MIPLCSTCLHALDAAGFCDNERCVRCPRFATGYSVEPPKLSEAPDPFPGPRTHCPMCGREFPVKE